MAFRKRPADENPSIPMLIWRLRDAYDVSEFDEVEEQLIVREMRLKRSHEKQSKEWEEKLKSEMDERKKLEDERRVWKEKYEKLLEKAKRWGVDADQKEILELKKKNKVLHEEKMKMFRDLESAVSRLEDETQKVMSSLGTDINTGQGSDHGEARNDKGSKESAPALDLENGFDFLKENEEPTGPKKTSGIGNVASDAIEISDSDDDESARPTLYGKKSSEKDEGSGFLSSVAGVAKKPQILMLKRKKATTPSIGNNENDDGDIALDDDIPISDLLRKQGKKLHLGLSSSLVTGKDASSAFSNHGKQANQSSRDPVILTQSEENRRKKQKSLPKSSKPHAKARYHTLGSDTDDSDETSSGSPDSEYEKCQSLFNDIFQIAKK